MSLLICLLIGCLFAAGVFLILRGSLFRIALGIALLGHAVNLAIMTVGGLTEGETALIPEAASILPSTAADPLPQALILTAIVIGFGMQAFLMVLIRNGSKYAGISHTQALNEDLE